MSVASSEALERSVLEAKDREQLITIAGALGVKALTRAKKADIIDKILEQVGAGSPDATAPRAGATARTARGRAAARSDDPVDDRLDGGADAAGDEATDGSSDGNVIAPAAAAIVSDPAANVTASRPARGSDAADEVILGPDGEPLAEWEIALVRAGEPLDGPAARPTPAGRGATGANRAGGRPFGGAGSTPSGPTRSGQPGAGQPGAGASTAAVRPTSVGAQGPGTNGSGANGSGGNGALAAGPGAPPVDRNDPLGDAGEREGGRRRRRRNRNRKGGEDGTGGTDRDDLQSYELASTGPASSATPVAPASGSSPGSAAPASDAVGGFGSNDPVEVQGYLDLRDEGYGFLRVNGYLPSRDDAYISVKQTRQYGLRKGDHVTGMCRPAGRNEKNPALLSIATVNGDDPDKARGRRRFEDLTPLFPDTKFKLESASDPNNVTARIIDLICPIGKGQRGLIVSPPKAGKTTVMKTIATAIERNHPEVRLIVLLIDERPEEVTDMRRTVKGEVIASTFDRPSEEHAHVAELAIEKAKRMVEKGEDVVVILDGITRLSRAYNLSAPASGRIMSGGIDAGALYPPKKFFGAARNVEEGGSLTILATALVETNSRMDDAIFEEFKGTGNMELKLDRKLADRRIYPAIDVDASSTRHEELLFDRKQLQMVWKLRRVLSGLAHEGSAAPGLELLIDRLKTFRNNDEFLAEISKQPGM